MPSVEASPSRVDPSVVRGLIASALGDLRGIRHDLHAHPELAYEEHRTAQVVRTELARLGIAHVSGLAGGTGVVAHLRATTSDSGAAPGPARAIGLRADMDALPITERTGLAYASTAPGRMHACGHDGHTTILLGVARVLQQMPRPHPVTLIFQPAEEGGAGAERLCSEGLLRGEIIGPPIGHVLGLHGWPDLPLGAIGTRPGPLLASTDEINIVIHGVQSHGAYPHYGRDPIVCAAHVITALQSVASRSVGPLDSVVVSLGQINGGTATNVIPDRVELAGTIRALTPGTRALARQRVHEIAEGVAGAMGCRAEVALHEGYPVTYNDPASTERFLALARGTLGDSRVVVTPHPTMGGEDFSYYAREVPGVFFFLGLRPQGAAHAPSLHQPDFDFNDDAMPTGIEMMVRAATN